MIYALNMTLEGFFDDDDEDYFDFESKKSHRENTPRKNVLASDFNSYNLRRYMCKILRLGYAAKDNNLIKAFEAKIINDGFKREMCDLFDCLYMETNEELVIKFRLAIEI